MDFNRSSEAMNAGKDCVIVKRNKNLILINN